MKKTVNRKRLIQAMGVFSVFCLLVLLAIAGGKEMQRTSFSAAKDVKEPSRAGKVQLTDVVRVMKNPYKVIDEVSGSEDIQIFGVKPAQEDLAVRQVNPAVEALQDSGYEVSFLMMDLETKEGLAKDADRMYYSASAIKGPYICAVNCTCPEEAAGYHDVMEQIIVNSSNEDYEMCRYIFGQEPMTEYMAEMGDNTVEWDTDYAYLSTKDFAKLWVRNYEYMFSDEANAKWTRSIFDHSLNSFINEALSSGSNTVYSKAGWIDSVYDVGIVYNDAGIIIDEDEHAYLIAVMSSAYGEHELLQDLVNALDVVHDRMIQ